MTKKQQDLDTFGSNNEWKYVLSNILLWTTIWLPIILLVILLVAWILFR